MLTQSKKMTDLKELITNIELCSRTDGYSTITFPTLKKLSVSGKALGSSLASIAADKSSWEVGFVPAGRPRGTP